jgi:hypothetical protein
MRESEDDKTTNNFSFSISLSLFQQEEEEEEAYHWEFVPLLTIKYVASKCLDGTAG